MIRWVAPDGTILQTPASNDPASANNDGHGERRIRDGKTKAPADGKPVTYLHEGAVVDAMQPLPYLRALEREYALAWEAVNEQGEPAERREDALVVLQRVWP